MLLDPEFHPDLVNKAIGFATAVHYGQYRGDDPLAAYIQHPLRVMHSIRKYCADLDIDIECAMAAAVLHDTIEDASTKAISAKVEEHIRAEYPDLVYQVVKRLTHMDKRTYPEYIRDVITLDDRPQLTQIATLVKLFDAMDNSMAVLKIPVPAQYRGTVAREVRQFMKNRFKYRAAVSTLLANSVLSNPTKTKLGMVIADLWNDLDDQAVAWMEDDHKYNHWLMEDQVRLPRYLRDAVFNVNTYRTDHWSNNNLKLYKAMERYYHTAIPGIGARQYGHAVTMLQSLELEIGEL